MYWHYVVLVAVTTLIASAQAVSTKKDVKIAAFSTLTANHDDTFVKRSLRTIGEVDEERGITVSAVEKLKTKIAPWKVTDYALQRWAKNGKSIDNAFARLKLDKVKGELLSSPQFLTWLKYVDEFNAKNPTKSVSMISTLTAHYGDVALAKIIAAAKKVEDTSSVATKLEGAQLHAWLTSGKTLDDTFTLLKLDQTGDKLLESPLLNTWISYMKVLNKENPKARTSLIEELTKRYGDEGVVKLLDTAKKVPNTSRIAYRIEAEQIQHWLASKKSPDDIFTLLKLDKAGDELFASPQLATWEKYVQALAKENPDDKTTLISTMTSHYGDEGVSKILESAKKIVSTETLATRLQAEQIKYWVNSGKTPESVFKLLKLDKAGDTLLASPHFSTWITFSNAFYAKNPGNKLTTIWVLRAYYRDDVLARMILATEKVPSTKGAAQRVEDEMLKSWMGQLITPDEAFKLLRLDKAEDVFESPLLSFWNRYLDHFKRAKTNDDSSLVTALMSSHDDEALFKIIDTAKKVPRTEEIGTKLQAEQIKRWLADKESPDEIFELLKLNEAGKGLLTNSWLNTWVTYLKAYNKQIFAKKTTMIGTFSKYFGDEALAQMLTAAKSVPSTKKLATDLQHAQLSQWLLAKKDPESVAKLLNAKEVSDVNWGLSQKYAAQFKNAYRTAA